MNKDNEFVKAQELGISSPYAKGFMAYDEVNGKIQVNYAKTAKMLAQDAALTTTANVGIPAALVTYIDPSVTEILFSAMNANKLVSEVKRGDWTDKYTRFTVTEYVGSVTPYSDHGENVSSDLNFETPERENFLFQTVIRYGDLEEATVARARLNLASQKQKAAALILAKAHNKFYLYGVAGKKIYGLLNDPNLPSAASPISVTIGGNSYSTWADKAANDAANAANHVYNDVLKLINALCAANGGNVDANTPMTLAVSNVRAQYLNALNTYGLSATKMLKDNYPNLEIVQLPELSTGAGEMLYLIVPEVFASSTAELAYSEKMRMSRIVPEVSAFKQKAIGGTWGAIIKRPSLIQLMTGI